MPIIRRKKSSFGLTVKETSPGHLSIKCEISGRPLTRANIYGMFCDSKPCQCEQESVKHMRELKQMIKDIEKE